MNWAKAHHFYTFPFPLQLKQEAIQRLPSQFLNRNVGLAHSGQILISHPRALAQKSPIFYLQLFLKGPNHPPNGWVRIVKSNKFKPIEP